MVLYHINWHGKGLDNLDTNEWSQGVHDSYTYTGSTVYHINTDLVTLILQQIIYA